MISESSEDSAKILEIFVARRAEGFAVTFTATFTALSASDNSYLCHSLCSLVIKNFRFRPEPVL